VSAVAEYKKGEKMKKKLLKRKKYEGYAAKKRCGTKVGNKGFMLSGRSKKGKIVEAIDDERCSQPVFISDESAPKGIKWFPFKYSDRVE
jgi:lipid-binding SYLF domain-containing protein